MRALDGPAAGINLSLRSCPTYLRLVHGPDGWDALDQPEDRPQEGETVWPYRIVDGTWGVVFVRPGGRYEYGDYRVIEDVEPGLPAMFGQNRDLWRAWLMLHHARLVLEGGGISAQVAADTVGLDVDVFRRKAADAGGVVDDADVWRLPR